MKKRVTGTLVLLFMMIMLLGCGTNPFYPQAKEQQPLAPGQVLVIGKFDLNPAVEIGKIKKIHGARVPAKGEMQLYTAAKADVPVTRGKYIPFAFPIEGLETFNVKYNKTSFVPMPAGMRYIRKGELATGIESVTTTTGGHIGVEGRVLEIYGDILLDVPLDAKAVYIGTITWKHDGKETDQITVKDEFKQAMSDLKKMNIPGIGPKDVKKKLASVKK